MTSLLVPAYLPPARRCAGDAWVDAPGGIENALRYIVWQVLPVYAADGVTITTPGVPQVLTGYTVAGSLYYQSRCGVVPAAAVGLPVPVGTVVDLANAIISLSLTAPQTIFPKQDPALWNGGNPDGSRALLVAQPRIVDPNGNPLTVGFQQVFVF